MRKTRRLPLALALLGLLLGFLAGCSSDSDNDASSTPSVSSSTPVIVATSSADQVRSMANRFVSDYRAAAPKMAKGFSDAKIAEVAAHVCEFTTDPKADRAAAITKLSKEMTNNGVKPNDAAVLKIMKTAVRDTCPQQQDALARLI
jgi:type IV pilus biogenesis protein CpaD/CtpE